MSDLWSTFRNDENGAAAIEYGLIAAFVAIAIVPALNLLGGEVSTFFEDVLSAMEAAIR